MRLCVCDSSYSLNKVADFHAIQQIKEKFCYVAYVPPPPPAPFSRTQRTVANCADPVPPR